MNCITRFFTHHHHHYRETLVGAVTQLVARHLSWSSAQVFRVLRVLGVIYRALVIDCLPYITQAVTTTEEKRGTGLDNTLRLVGILLVTSGFVLVTFYKFLVSIDL